MVEKIILILIYSSPLFQKNGHEDDKLEGLGEVETPDKLADFFVPENYPLQDLLDKLKNIV